MISKINFRDNSFTICISIKTWVYIMGLISLDLNENHTPCFRSLFSKELSEIKELYDFKPPIKFDFDSHVVLKFKEYEP